jgi:homoserine kinase type II
MINLNKKEIKKILTQYNIGELLNFKKLTSHSNYSYLLITNSGKFVLRLSGDFNRARTKSEIKGELLILDLLKKKNYPVINCENNKNGQIIICFKNHYGYIRKFAEGKQIKENPSSKQVYKVGRILGRLHKITKNYKAANLRSRINFDIDTTKKYFKKEKKLILKSNFKENFVKIFEKELNQIKIEKNLPKGVIHEDLGKRHVFWRKDEISAVIDFDRSYYGFLILDLGQTLRGWCFVDDWSEWSKFNCRLFLKGYERERKLNKNEKKFLLAAIKFGILERALSFCAMSIYHKNNKIENEEFAKYSLFKLLNKIEI